MILLGHSIAPFGAGRERIEHPCPRPLEQVGYFLGLTDSGTVLDPFMGSGTTLRAAKDLGRKAIGIEIEEKYCEIAARRLSQQCLEFPREDEKQRASIQSSLLETVGGDE